MITRRGIMAVELSIACIGIGAATLLITSGLQDRVAMRQLDARSAQCEQMQNILDDLRHGADPQLPTGWTISRASGPAGLERITVTSPAGNLSTLATLRRVP